MIGTRQRERAIDFLSNPFDSLHLQSSRLLIVVHDDYKLDTFPLESNPGENTDCAKVSLDELRAKLRQLLPPSSCDKSYMKVVNGKKTGYFRYGICH